ncbi:hypothetical protein KZ797_28705 [Pseudomonas aeruginosa]|nr:hypothetical protein KZ797_28705 [Pseudomonas aeruginosa]
MVDVVDGHQDAQPALPGQLSEQIEQFDLAAQVERAGRFVQQEDARVTG